MITGRRKNVSYFFTNEKIIFCKVQFNSIILGRRKNGSPRTDRKVGVDPDERHRFSRSGRFRRRSSLPVQSGQSRRIDANDLDRRHQHHQSLFPHKGGQRVAILT